MLIDPPLQVCNEIPFNPELQTRHSNVLLGLRIPLSTTKHEMTKIIRFQWNHANKFLHYW